MAKKFKAITFQEFEGMKDVTSVWVRNTSSGSLGPLGKVHINIKESTGGSTVVTVYDTWIPIDLSTYVTKQSLLNSGDFRRMVAMQMIQLIDPKEAEEFMLNDKDAQVEAKRIYNRQDNTDMASAPDSVKAVTAEGSVNSMVINVCGGEFEEDAALSMIRANAPDFKAIDFDYLLKNSTHAKVKSFAASELADMAQPA